MWVSSRVGARANCIAHAPVIISTGFPPHGRLLRKYVDWEIHQLVDVPWFAELQVT
jgi:hypothetical protein